MKSFTSGVRDHIECLVLTPFLITFSLSQYVHPDLQYAMACTQWCFSSFSFRPFAVFSDLFNS